MSYELVKYQSQEGFSYAPGANKHINFDFSETGVIDMSKSYVILNTTAVVTPDPTIVTGVGGQYVMQPALGVLGSNGQLPYKPSCLVRNSRLNSRNTQFYLENRELNLREANLQLYTKNVADHQKDALTGAGYSVLDSETGRIKQSVFMNKICDGTVLSEALSPDLIVPLADLLGDVGDMELFPAGLIGDMHLELEIEDRFDLVDVRNNLAANVEIDYAAGVASVDDTTADSDIINIPSGFLKNSNGLQEAELYTGMPLALQITIDGAVENAGAIIIAITNNSVAGTKDGFGVEGGPDLVQITLNKTIGTLVGHAAGDDKPVTKLVLSSEKLFTGTPSYVINRAELVIARKRLPSQAVRDYFSAIVREGMTYDCYETIAWNRSNATDVNEFYTLPPMTKFVMNLTPNMLGTTGQAKALYSYIEGMQSYRWTVGDMDTTNRDVLVANSTSGLYKHKVKSAITAMGKSPKALGSEVSNLMTGLNASASFVAYPLEYVPAVPANLPLKLNMKGSSMPTGDSYLILKREKTMTF
jgi:hypothetical protein